MYNFLRTFDDARKYGNKIHEKIKGINLVYFGKERFKKLSTQVKLMRCLSVVYQLIVSLPFVDMVCNINRRLQRPHYS